MTARDELRRSLACAAMARSGCRHGGMRGHALNDQQAIVSRRQGNVIMLISAIGFSAAGGKEHRSRGESRHNTENLWACSSEIYKEVQSVCIIIGTERKNMREMGRSLAHLSVKGLWTLRYELWGCGESRCS